MKREGNDASVESLMKNFRLLYSSASFPRISVCRHIAPNHTEILNDNGHPEREKRRRWVEWLYYIVTAVEVQVAISFHESLLAQSFDGQVPGRLMAPSVPCIFS